MKDYDFKKAMEYINEHKEELLEVSLGMKEDWSWTAETIFSENEFKVDLTDEKLDIAGITGSGWATPAMLVETKDGEEKFIDCYKGESTSVKPSYFELGVLSGPCQDAVDKIETKEE